jgi:hypothetical protein
MFRLHETTRRLLCQTGFLTLCVLPTTVVLGWGMSHRSAAHKAACTAELSSQLGLRATFDELSYPRPDNVLYEGFQLADPETGSVLLKCRTLAAARIGNTLVLKATQTELYGQRVEHLWDLLGRRLRQELSGADWQVRLLAGEVTWHADKGSQTFTEVIGRIVPSQHGQDASLTFRLAGADVREPATLHIVRYSQANPPSTGVALRTGADGLPCSVFAPLVDGAGWLGARSQFAGYLWAKQATDGWEGEITGQLTQLDLGTLVSNHFPHRLEGEAEVQFERGRFQQGRLVEAAGTLAAGPGVISRSLLLAGMQYLNLRPGSHAPPASSPVPYERLACDFLIDAQGLRITGRCPEPAGAVLADIDQALWRQPVEQPQPVVALLRTLVPQNDIQVPATRESDWLMQRLPLPRVMTPAAPDGAPSEPRVHVRLK